MEEVSFLSLPAVAEKRSRSDRVPTQTPVRRFFLLHEVAGCWMWSTKRFEEDKSEVVPQVSSIRNTSCFEFRPYSLSLRKNHSTEVQVIVFRCGRMIMGADKPVMDKPDENGKMRTERWVQDRGLSRKKSTFRRKPSEQLFRTPKIRRGQLWLLTSWIYWWSWAGSNRWPLECHSSALPTELQPQLSLNYGWGSPIIVTWWRLTRVSPSSQIIFYI